MGKAIGLLLAVAAIAAGEVSSYTAFGLCFEWTSTALAFWLLRAGSAPPNA